MGYAEGPTARSAPRRICTGSDLWELYAVGTPLFRALFSLLTNFARNSPAAVSKIELWSLELQRFWMLLNVHAVELRATLWSQHVRIAVFAVSCIWNLRVLDRKLSSG